MYFTNYLFIIGMSLGFISLITEFIMLKYRKKLKQKI